MNGRLAVFDIDGTLCNTFEVDDECFRATVGDVLDTSIDADEWTLAPQITDSGLIPWLWERVTGRAPSADQLTHFADVYERRLLEEYERAPARFRPVGGARELLETLPGRGWDVCIATGGWSRLARLKLRAAGLPSDLLLACADDSPDRAEIFRTAGRRAREAASSSHSRTVLVGDGVWDARVARALGWPMLGVGADARAAHLAEHGALTIVADFSDPDAIVASLAVCTVPLGLGG